MATPTPVDTLLPPNADRMEVELERAIGHRLDSIPVPVDLLSQPSLAPASVLPWLAWALSVDRWDTDWPEATKRQVIAAAWEAHREKGTLAAVRRALADIGAVADIAVNPDGNHHTMRVDILNSGSLLTSAIADVREQLEEAKRLSVHMTVTTAAGFTGEIPIAAAMTVEQFVGFRGAA